jgi:hypothetical protein
MKRFFTSLSIAATLTLLYTGVAYAQGGTADPSSGGEVAAKLAGLVAAATLVERIIEMIWDFVENKILTAKSLINNVGDYVGWASNQVHAARKNLIASTDTAKRTSLEQELRDAEKRVTDFLKSDTWVTQKKKISVPVSLGLGLIVAVLAQLRMFVLLDLLPANTTGILYVTDIIVTGLVIGTGSAPVHSLIGVIQKTKDTLDAVRGMYTGKALAEVREMVELLQEGKFEAAGGEEETLKERSPLELERMARSMVDL